MSLSILEAIMVFLRQLPLISWARNASLQLHSDLLGRLARATSTFYDVTPMGRLLSRFSKDMNLIDDNIQFQFDSYIQQLALLAGLFAQMAATQPYLVIVIVAAGILFFLLQRSFQSTAVNIQRLEAISRAPIFSHLSESIEGASSIRAYKMQKAFTRAAINKVNDNITDYLAFRYAFSWFALRLDWLGALVIIATFLSVVVTKNNGTIAASLAALALSSTSSITQVLSSTANWAVQLEATMNSVERIRQYMDVDQESAAHIEDTKPEAAWPEKGAVRFKKLSISYNKDGSAPVLQKISAVVKPKEKIGIVGRTGAGKSTLITALFRMVEPSEGTIEIDGVDIRKLGLTDLRSKLSIIPQLPTLFMGSVRYNIDPFNESTDDAIWRALEMVQLKDYISSLEGKLEAPIEEGGSNFSVGQRQLLSMARALLRNSRVLLLDEATAAVDNETDAMIQTMVRKNFKSQTVFTIAHRLNTIMDSTRVMVLDKGKLVEFDTPAKLLENPDSIFTSMVDATGPASAEYLRKIARGELSVVESLSTPELKRKRPSTK
jgi:ABC-type multidrug transport system fused ATPase/permease subunit